MKNLFNSLISTHSYTSACCTAIMTCVGVQRFAENTAPIALNGSCVFCKSLKANAQNTLVQFPCKTDVLLFLQNISYIFYRG